jgi:hypothetical protein
LPRGTNEHPAAKAFNLALVQDGIPATSLGVEDVSREYERLLALGVRFTQPPTEMGPVPDAQDGVSATGAANHLGR